MPAFLTAMCCPKMKFLFWIFIFFSCQTVTIVLDIYALMEVGRFQLPNQIQLFNRPYYTVVDDILTILRYTLNFNQIVCVML